MSKALKCDRCGDYYEPYEVKNLGGSCRKGTYRLYQARVETSSDTDISRNTIDLCKFCATEFERYWLPTIDLFNCSKCRYAVKTYDKDGNVVFSKEDIVCSYWNSDGLNETDQCSRGVEGDYLNYVKEDETNETD